MLQCVAMNRSLTKVLFGGAAPALAPENYKIGSHITQINADDVVVALVNADNVIVVWFLRVYNVTQSHVSVVTGSWIRYGSGEGTVHDIRNHILIASKRGECTIRDPSCRGTHSKPVQCSACGSIGALR
jgi:hypothetical protein